MAITGEDVLLTALDGVTIASGATSTSLQLTTGPNLLAVQDIVFYVTLTGTASAPSGSKLLTLQVAPIPADGGSAHWDGCLSYPLSAVADQTYRWAPIAAQLPEFFAVRVVNSLGVDTDANAVTVQVGFRRVTST